MSGRAFDSPPPYHSGSEYNHGSVYAPSKDIYDGEMRSQPAGSYYPDETQYFYKWSSPPGIIKILAILIIVMSIGIFACVASTLPWDMDYYGGGMGVGNGMGYGGYGGYGGAGAGYGSGTGYGYGAGVGAYGYGGGYTDPRAAKGFMIALAAVSFIGLLIVFIVLVSKARLSRTRKFYLILMIVSAVIGFIMFVATMVYIMGVNPTAQAAGSVFYNQLLTLCNQFYIPSTSGVYTNQYLYHYCVVEPQEALAIVMGFLIVIALGLIIFFAFKTRSKITRYGKENILWDKSYMQDEVPPNVEDWVNNVSGVPEELVGDGYSYKPNGSLYEPDYEHHRTQPNGVQPTHVPEVSLPLMNEQPAPNPSIRESDESKPSSHRKPNRKRRPGRPKRPETEDYETDYTTGAESCDELDEEDFESQYPPITSDQQRLDYKKEFDNDHQQYKYLQAELDDINKQFSQLNKQIDETDDDEQYQAVAAEYNRIKEVKNSADYREKKKLCKQLKVKLSHIKQMVSNYDSQRP
ncbi:occludin b [Scyliorhinus canicula]|uniref:occludin b n=1 Tax=Scyliorhinus canicula TaxID=7830 RepID=UPI0018F67417|nr:occludin b [Scyliorhinus canicula]XP_038661338.1 occludin b [Scyliorhinus canicula]